MLLSNIFFIQAIEEIYQGLSGLDKGEFKHYMTLLKSLKTKAKKAFFIFKTKWKE